MRVQFATLSIDLAYDQEKSVTIKRFPTEYEVKKLKKSKYQLVDKEVLTSDNRLELKMYHNPRRKHITVFSGGNYDFKEGGQYGVDIDIKIKEPEKELIDYLCTLSRELCEKHFKKAIIFPSRRSVACQIDECKLTHNSVNMFLEDFVIALESKIGDFKVTKKEKEIEEGAEERVKKYEEQLGIKEEKIDESTPLPPLAEPNDDFYKPKLSKKWKNIIIGLSIIIMILLVLLSGKLLNVI
jgi:hypothetical protein